MVDINFTVHGIDTTVAQRPVHDRVKYIAWVVVSVARAVVKKVASIVVENAAIVVEDVVRVVVDSVAMVVEVMVVIGVDAIVVEVVGYEVAVISERHLVQSSQIRHPYTLSTVFNPSH